MRSRVITGAAEETGSANDVTVREAEVDQDQRVFDTSEIAARLWLD